MHFSLSFYKCFFLLYTSCEGNAKENSVMDIIIKGIQMIYQFLWGDLITIPLPGESSLGLSLLVLILIPSGIYFTIRTRFLPFRFFPEMLKISMEKKI